MRKKLKTAVWILFFISLGGNLLAWGGLALDREFGPIVDSDLGTQAPIAALYVWAGRNALPPLGLEELARSRAERWFGHSYPAMRANPDAALDTLILELGFVVRLSYYGCLVLLLAGLILHATSPKPLRTFGGH